jgi:hypothetical protein
MKASITPTSLLAPIVKLWHTLWNGTFHYPDVRVWQQCDRHGRHSGWHGYDPLTGEYVAYGTEAEIRSWIEQRYYDRSLHW